MRQVAGIAARATPLPNRVGQLAPRRWGAACLAALAGLLWLAGPCARAEAPAPDQPTAVELTLVGGPGLNPNSEGRASPVVVRIFDLAAARSFESADFQALFDHPGDVLKQDLLAQEELVLRPGDIQQRNRNLESRVQALGVAAAFRDLEHAVWRLTIPVKPGQRSLLLIDLDRDTVRLVTVDSGHS